ncbi:AAA family ATPase [Methylomonas sp. UP202]|uniref:AAA family ATPase n=1 Tax=Methylomonas sp. UP202 TaxID=3040943 RepID=UPI00247A3BFB|nr:AAA family ATPase [Methylomonas sp. UP202]WGS85797.1 AAA family ATPase [Methylomonas sp. UP202]
MIDCKNKLSPIETLRQLTDGFVQRIPATNHLDATVHQWSQAEIDALTLAISARRPLLVRGEPGTGKTQLARAVAQQLGWVLHATTIHPRFEASDLLYRFDAVKRLADAQAREPHLIEHNYWEPGPLWKAYDWQLACEYGSCRPKLGDDPQTEPEGHVVLLDEIDKADSDLPNSLLDVLGQRAFEIPALNLRFGAPSRQLPLILITTNEERELPAAFIRRCIVLNLSHDPELGYEEWLAKRGLAHFAEGRDAGRTGVPVEIIRLAAKRLVEDRNNAEQAALPPPGLAEFIDLLSALVQLAPDDAILQERWLKRLSGYAFIKHRPVEGVKGTQQQRPFDSGLTD